MNQWEHDSGNKQDTDHMTWKHEWDYDEELQNKNMTKLIIHNASWAVTKDLLEN